MTLSECGKEARRCRDGRWRCVITTVMTTMAVFAIDAFSGTRSGHAQPHSRGGLSCCSPLCLYLCTSYMCPATDPRAVERTVVPHLFSRSVESLAHGCCPREITSNRVI